MVPDHLHVTFHWDCEGTDESGEVILKFVGYEWAVEDTTYDLPVDAEYTRGVVGLLLEFLFRL